MHHRPGHSPLPPARAAVSVSCKTTGQRHWVRPRAVTARACQGISQARKRAHHTKLAGLAPVAQQVPRHARLVEEARRGQGGGHGGGTARRARTETANVKGCRNLKTRLHRPACI